VYLPKIEITTISSKHQKQEH